MPQPRKIYIKTYGCQMNVYDSVRMADVMAPEGYETTEQPAEADVVILNTCHIREKASEKLYSDLGRIRLMKQQRSAEGMETLIAVAGCVAQAEGEEILARAPYVDVVVGPQGYHELPDLIGQARRKKAAALNLTFNANEKFDRLPELSGRQGISAFVSVQEGCDKFCTFCVVPYTRGAEYSRPSAAIMEEVKALVSRHGAREITLLGQNVNAYHGEGQGGQVWSLGRLIREIADIEDVQRIRYTTSHPKDMDDELITAHGEVDKLMPYLHLPVQSGSDRVLKAMNRKHTAAEYLAIIEKLRAARPDIAFSSDFIVGFPGETDADFEATLKLVEMVGYAQAYSFQYSPRPGTPAAEAEEQVDDEVKALRLQRLQALLVNQQQAFNDRMVGRTLEVLFDQKGKHVNQYLGKSPYLQSVHVRSEASLLNQTLAVQIVAATASSLTGEFDRNTAYPTPNHEVRAHG